MKLLVYQAVTLGFGHGPFDGIWTAGMRVHRWAPIGHPTGRPSMVHNGESFYTPVRFVDDDTPWLHPRT